MSAIVAAWSAWAERYAWCVAHGRTDGDARACADAYVARVEVAHGR